MINKVRVWYPNTTHHVTIRGNRRNDIFRDKEDFEVYLAQLEGNIKYYKNEYDIVCYCLMDNHVHLLLHTYDKHINYFMKRINSIYPRYFNNKYNYCGHLYEKRYFSEIVDSDSQMLETSRYIHLNPIRANIVDKPEYYNWSSYSMYIGDKKEKFINSSMILNYFNVSDRRKEYKSFVEQVIRNSGNSDKLELIRN
ncbi:transposase [Clostridium sp. DL1XJH146]